MAFITYEKGESEAKIRFKAENFAKPIAEKWVGLESVEIKELKVIGSLLEVSLPDSSLCECRLYIAGSLFLCSTQTKSVPTFVSIRTDRASS